MIDTLEVASEKKANHRANVIRISELIAHPDPETTSLELVMIDGFQLVVKKGQFTVGDLAVHIQPDSIVPQTEPFKFIWEQYVTLDGTVPENRRRITVRKFRKQWSEGLLLPLSDFLTNGLLIDGQGKILSQYSPSEGTDVSDIIGIKHYDPDTAGPAGTKGTNSNGPKRKFRYPRSVKGWLKFLWSIVSGKQKLRTEAVPFVVPTYDVDALKNYKDAFIPGEPVVFTEKIHGSNARFVYLDGVMYAGSRNLWKSEDSDCIWRKALRQNPWIEDWCREHEGYALYGEVAPTQKGFSYGAKDGQVRFFWFDIYTPGKEWVDYDDYGKFGINESIGKYAVPLLYYGPFNLERIMKLVDGPSVAAGGLHIREGIVGKTVRERSQRGLGRTQLKIVSNVFLEKDNK